MTAKTAGQLAYEADCALCPDYHDGAPRRPWTALDDVSRYSWERDPTPRAWIVRNAGRRAAAIYTNAQA